jgi:putative spermidine/putrescine transport system substrate-binding protein
VEDVNEATRQCGREEEVKDKQNTVATNSAGRLSGRTRRQFLKASAAAGAVALSAPWVTTKARAAGEINVVLNQGLLAKLWVDDLHPKFEKETGAKINLQQSVTSQMLAMLKTQKDDPPDLMQFSEAGVFVAVENGLLRQHNAKNIANIDSLRDSFNLADLYSVGVVDAPHTLFYNTDRIKQAPGAWADLWDTANKGLIAIPPVKWNNGVRIVTSAAQVATGKPFKDAQYDWQAGIDHLAKLKGNDVVVYTGAPQAIQMLQSGQVPIVPFYGIFINPLIDGGAPIAPAHPLKEGMHGEIVGLNMPLNAANVELAEVYVGMSLDKAFQSKIDGVLRTRSAHKEVNPSARTLELMGPPDNILYADWAYLSKERAKITEKWNEIFG